jgi:hypothetical protein
VLHLRRVGRAFRLDEQRPDVVLISQSLRRPLDLGSLRLLKVPHSLSCRAAPVP